MIGNALLQRSSINFNCILCSHRNLHRNALLKHSRIKRTINTLHNRNSLLISYCNYSNLRNGIWPSQTSKNVISCLTHDFESEISLSGSRLGDGAKLDRFAARSNSVLSCNTTFLFAPCYKRCFSTSAVLRLDPKIDEQFEIIKDIEREKRRREEKKDGLEKAEGSTESQAVSELPPQSSLVATPQLSLATRVWVKTKKELVHYYNGFKLFFLETWISWKLMRKVMNGDVLTRRERKQLLTTVADIFRLVPFLIFIIIPFMELLLPVAVKMFPGLLPSTFAEKSEKDKMAKQRFKLKLDMARFLQGTVEQMALKSDSRTSETAQKFSDFMLKVRKGDLQLSNDEIIKFSKAFRDSLMMDSLERQQLTAICKILNIRPIGNTNILRFQIKLKMRKIKSEDQLILKEGNIEFLDVNDLQNLVRDRGMRAFGVSKERLVTQLKEWIDLHLNDKVPLSLLLLSRTLYIPPSEPGGLDATTADQLKATISSLPSEASDYVKLRLEELESGQIDNLARLEKVKREQLAIAAEAAEKEEAVKHAKMRAEKAKEKEAEKLLDTALHDYPPGYDASKTTEMQPPTTAEVNPFVIRVVEEALTDIAEAKTRVSEERDDLNELIQEIHDYNSSLKETLAVAENKVKVRRGSKLLSRYLQYTLKKMRPNLTEIEKDRKAVQQKIEQLSAEKKEALDEETVNAIESKIETHEGTVASIDEVKTAILALTKVSDDDLMSEITKIIDPDADGVVEIDTVVKAIEFISYYSSETISPEVLRELIDVLSQEFKTKNLLMEKEQQQKLLEQNTESSSLSASSQLGENNSESSKLSK